MDGVGFHVEPDVLDDAAHAMDETADAEDGTELGTPAGPPERYGHDGVHAAAVEFGRAWTVGVDALCDRARSNAVSLREVARAYRDAEAGVSRVLEGEDPARAVVEPRPPLLR